MKFTLKETRLLLRNSTTRIPFRYGSACLTKCPQAILRVTLEVAGQRQTGYSGDCLPPSWFDKNPDKDFARQISDMQAAIGKAEQIFLQHAAKETTFFDSWLPTHHDVAQWAEKEKLPELLASFGVSMVERAIMDALARHQNMSFFDAVRQNIFALRPEEVHSELAGWVPKDWLPTQPTTSIFARQTVGLGDPLFLADIAAEDRLDDGFPQAIEEYIRQCGVKYFKIKLRNDLPSDMQRMTDFAGLAKKYLADDYWVTLDGNEQYKQADDFDALLDAIENEQALATLWRNTLTIEQPLERSISLNETHTAGIRSLGARKSVIIDESDGTLDSFSRAIELGYRGVSSKNCKGAVKSLLNAGLVWLRNDRGTRADFLMTGEDLCSVGVVPTQSDLCLVATLGLTHVERNGHHYHPGLDYLPRPQQQAALAAHAGFYAEKQGRVIPQIRDGKFDISSLQCAGYGFAALPNEDDYTPSDEWDFSSLEA